MRNKDMRYIRVRPESDLPKITDMEPFLSVVIIDEAVTPEWQTKVSDWLVNSGCLYMMAWGEDCSSWDDSVDHSNMEAYDNGEIPEDKFVMTTWHEKEPLKEVFRFSKYSAVHPSVDITKTLLLHISNSEKEKEYSNEYKSA